MAKLTKIKLKKGEECAMSQNAFRESYLVRKENCIFITVMIRFSDLLPISAPFQISAPLRMCFC